jgi:hypothetical protein
MVMAAGKSDGKPAKITDKAFRPPTEAAMAMTRRARMHGELLINGGRPGLKGFDLAVILDSGAPEIVILRITTI